MLANRGTLNYPKNFNAEADADAIYNACKSSNTDEDAINKVMGQRSLKQRLEISEAYKRRYQKDLLEVLKSKTTGEYDSMLQTLLRKFPKLLAYDLYKGMKGTGTNSNVINEIICCANNSEITAIKKAYAEGRGGVEIVGAARLFPVVILPNTGLPTTLLRRKRENEAASRSLEEDVGKETKPPYETFVLRLLKAQRQEDQLSRVEQAQRNGNIYSLVDRNAVEKDVQSLYAASGGRDGKGDPDPFISIIADRSKYHIKAIWELYKERHGRTLVQDISKKFSDPLRTGLNTSVMAQVNLLLLMTCQLHESMRGIGTREDTLTRLLILRSEVDLGIIKTLYQEYYSKSLDDAVKSETSGDYRKLLMMMLGN